MIDIDKILSEVKHHFSKNLPVHLAYHNWAHTFSVYRNVQHIGKKTRLREKEIRLLRIAALFHDIAYLQSKVNHEERSCVMMEAWLSNYGISSEDLISLKGMIMATKIPQRPTNLMERVMSDADLLYLGTSRYEVISMALYKEFQFDFPDLDPTKWRKIQIEFLSSHDYHTEFCKRYYKWKKQRNLNNVMIKAT